MKRHIIAYTLAVLTALPAMAQQEANIIDRMAAKGGFGTFCSLLRATGYADTLSQPLVDKLYDDEYNRGGYSLHPYARQDNDGLWYVFSSVNYGNAYLPQHKLHNFTVLAETDDVLRAIGVTGASAGDIAKLAAHLKSIGVEGDAQADCRKAESIVNRWVAYHILPAAMTPEQLVVHYNELGYVDKGDTRQLSMPIDERYETLGTPARLIKFTEGANTGGIRVNRFARINEADARIEDEVYAPGLVLGDSVAAPNGVAYALGALLAFTPETASMMGAERMRFDVCALVPELIAAGLRRPLVRKSYEDVAIPTTKAFSTHLVQNNASTGTLIYMPGTNSNWNNMQGDEFNGVDGVDMTLQLPPVPVTGTYELRMGISPSSSRTILHCWVGAGDGRMHSITPSVSQQEPITNYSYVADTDDEVANRTNDALLYAQGVMKAPASYQATPSATFDRSQSMRSREYSMGGTALRRILGRVHMEAGTTYYLRIADVSSMTNKQLYLDFIELCPLSVCDNPERMENIW